MLSNTNKQTKNLSPFLRPPLSLSLSLFLFLRVSLFASLCLSISLYFFSFFSFSISLFFTKPQIRPVVRNSSVRGHRILQVQVAMPLMNIQHRNPRFSVDNN